MSEGLIMALVENLVRTAIVLAFGIPLLRFYLRRKENQRPKSDPQLEGRLARMETTLDSIAVELERISENQRFTTKLMAEKEHIRATLSPDRSTE